MPTALRDLAADLLTGSHCLGCDQPGRLLCPDCAATLDRTPYRTSPEPCPPGLAPCWTAGEYDGLLRAMVLGHKEDGMLPLRPVLARVLADVVRAAVPVGALLLVPVPSRRSSVRRRGYDATRAFVSGAARLLARHGYDVRVAPLLSLRGGVQDQSGLDTGGRAENLDRALSCPAPGLARLARSSWAGRADGITTVVCDDVLTSGATAREAQRALEDVGLRVAAVTTLAATRRRAPPSRGRA